MISSKSRHLVLYDSPLYGSIHPPPTILQRNPHQRMIAMRAIRPSHGTVTEQRAVDVIIIGSGSLAAAAAVSLSRRGKRVVLIPDYGIKPLNPVAQGEGPRALCIPSISPVLTSMSQESAAYWGGLQSQLTGRQKLLWPSATLDLASLTGSTGSLNRAGEAGGSSTIAERLTLIQDSCKEVGVKLGTLKGMTGLQPVVPLLQHPHGEGGELVGLIQPGGGILSPSVASDALTSMAERAGALIRGRLVLTGVDSQPMGGLTYGAERQAWGWRDAGDHFVVSATSPELQVCAAAHAAATLSSSSWGIRSTSLDQGGQSEAVSVFEAEQLLLAPDEGQWPIESLELFGLTVDGLQTCERSHTQCQASGDLSRLPLIRYWGSDGAPPGGVISAESGNEIGSHQGSSWEFSVFPIFNGGSRIKVGGRPEAGGVGGRMTVSAWHWDPAQRTRGSNSLQDYCRRAAALVRGLSPNGEGPPLSLTGENPSKQTEQSMPIALCLATPDGLPVVGFHPGFEPGRVVVACSVSSAASALQTTTATTATTTVTSDQNLRGSGSVGRDMKSAHGIRQTVADDPQSNRGIIVHHKQHPSAPPPPPKPLFVPPPSLGDGFQLVPLLAKAAADLLVTGSMSLTAVSSVLHVLPVSARHPSHASSEDINDSPGRRSAPGEHLGGVHIAGAAQMSTLGKVDVDSWKGHLEASLALSEKGVDSWDTLGRLQDGSVQQYRSPEDVEREADEQEDLRRAKSA